MSNVMEEAAREFMKTAPIEGVSPYYEEDMIEMFRGGVDYALSLPLVERVTEAERERVRETYVAARDGCWDECNDMNINIAVESVLEDIFGTDFFGAEAPVLKQNTENRYGSRC